MKKNLELLKIVEPININTLSRINRLKKWDYGYNKDHDIIVISRSGQIGEIYEIQNLKIALPPHQHTPVSYTHLTLPTILRV